MQSPRPADLEAPSMTQISQLLTGTQVYQVSLRNTSVRESWTQWCPQKCIP